MPRGPATRKFQRAQPSQAEQERRKTWAREWAQPGRQWKANRDPKGK